MTAKHSKPTLQVGSVFAVPLAGQMAFGRLLADPLMAFYDLTASETPEIDTIIRSPVAFVIWVDNASLRSGRWPVLGARPLEENLQRPFRFFKKDPLNKSLSIYVDGQEIPATYEECKKLERAAVWSVTHVEDRLLDHFAGLPNTWVESLKA